MEAAIQNGACTYIVKHKKMKYFEAAAKRALATGMSLYLAKLGGEPVEDSSNAIDIPGNSPATNQLRFRVYRSR